jgi:acetoin utilization deacetylase AcuC-like enzyme
VVDLDVHQGNGTARIFRDDADVYTFSMHGRKIDGKAEG